MTNHMGIETKHNFKQKEMILETMLSQVSSIGNPLLVVLKTAMSKTLLLLSHLIMKVLLIKANPMDLP